MGLDISCKCGQIGFRAGSYTGFHYFRTWLADKLGFDLEEYWMSGCKPYTPFEPLLNHSDCDGYLTPRQCKQMIEPMREFIKRIEEEQKNVWYRILNNKYTREEELYFLEKCREWLEAFEHSYREKCRLIFC